MTVFSELEHTRKCRSDQRLKLRLFIQHITQAFGKRVVALLIFKKKSILHLLKHQNLSEGELESLDLKISQDRNIVTVPLD